jgi:hypothetical protein
MPNEEEQQPPSKRRRTITLTDQETDAGKFIPTYLITRENTFSPIHCISLQVF